MADNERTYVVPLRQYWRQAASYKRAKRAVNGLRKFVMRHMKVENVKIGAELNDAILSRGQRKPPARVQVTIVKEGNTGMVNLAGTPYRKELKKEEKKGLFGRKKEAEVKEEKHEHKPGEHHEHKHDEKHSEKANVKEEKTDHKKEEKPKAKKVTKKKDTEEKK